MKTYHLIINEYRIATLTVRRPDYFDGYLVMHEAWATETKEVCPDDNLFFADFTVKPDGCSHFYFHGQDWDYKKADQDSADSYYHICGAFWYERHMVFMWFIYQCAKTFYNEIGLFYDMENPTLDKISEFFTDYKIEERSD